MIKRLLIVVIVALVGLMGCEESNMSTWALTGQQTDLVAGVGIGDANGATIGLEVVYDISEGIEEDGWKPSKIGPYIEFNLSQVASITDTPEFSPIGDIIESFHAIPFIQLSILGSQDDSDIEPNWMAGTKFYLTPESQWPIIFAYRDGDNDRNGMFVGGSAMWRF